MPITVSQFKRDLGNLPSFPEIDQLISDQKKIDPEMIREIRKRGAAELWQEFCSAPSLSGTRVEACIREMERVTGSQAYDRAPSASYRAGIFHPEMFNVRDTTDYVVGSASAGAALVEQEIQDKDPIRALRATSAILRAGTEVIVTERNNISIPRISLAPIAGSGETQTVWATGSGASPCNVQQVVLNGIWCSTQNRSSGQIFAQASDRKFVSFIVDEMNISIGKMFDSLCLNGSGATNGFGQKLVPLGLLNY